MHEHARPRPPAPTHPPRLMAPTRKKLPFVPDHGSEAIASPAVLGPEAPARHEAVPAPGSPRMVPPGRRVDLGGHPVERDDSPHPTEDVEVVGEDGAGRARRAGKRLRVGVRSARPSPRSRTRPGSRPRPARSTGGRRPARSAAGRHTRRPRADAPGADPRRCRGTGHRPAGTRRTTGSPSPG